MLRIEYIYKITLVVYPDGVLPVNPANMAVLSVDWDLLAVGLLPYSS